MPKKLATLALALLARSLLAQESPLIVSTPRLSVKTFTNWQLIQLTYTISYLNDYDFLHEYAKPENMSFGQLELDPVLGKKQIVENRRSIGTQISLDLVYYLRHIGEKKGEITIPEQMFKYTKLVAGRRKEGEETFEVKSESVTIRYDSVLTKDADDIMDTIDFGSFSRQAKLWKYGAISGFLISFASAWLLIFRNPFRKNISDPKAKSADGTVAAQERQRLLPQEALKLFNKRLDEIKLLVSNGQNIGLGLRAELCNELRNLLLAYEPRLLPSDTTSEIKAKTTATQPKRLAELLQYLANWLEHNENIVYGLQNLGGIESDIAQIKHVADDLKRSRLMWFNLLAKKDHAKNHIIGIYNWLLTLAFWRRR